MGSGMYVSTAIARDAEAEPATFIVDTVEKAKEFMRVAALVPESIYFGCDTEADINIKKEGPVGNGLLTCISVYAGEGVVFGPDDAMRVWIDVLDGEPGIIEVIRPFFESNRWKTIWHNFGFDRHIMFNAGIDVRNLGGDTMHMARLHDSTRDRADGGGGYSLENLSMTYCENDSFKTGMATLFGQPVLLKSGLPGKKKVLPPITEIQRSPEMREQWINYSCLDAQATKELYLVLRYELQRKRWVRPKVPNFRDTYPSDRLTEFELYEQNILPFAVVLTDIERAGFQLDMKHLRTIEEEAKADARAAEKAFMAWCVDCGAFYSREDAEVFNLASGKQKQFLFFASDGRLKYSFKSGNKKSNVDEPAVFKAENNTGVIEEGKKVPGKFRNVTIKGLGLTPTEFTKKGGASTSALVFSKLAGNPQEGKFGPAVESIGKEGCFAIDELLRSAQISTLLGTFIEPLQVLADSEERIHCSLNLNTETGRLSSRNPNLQNQPALEKDIYKIRKAFISKPGHKLIVADYGQLELRVLAHLSNCKPMIEAFELGGDFHSRTAIDMYDYIQDAINKGEVLLEWDHSKGEPPAPLVKDKYATERRRAKVLNFSVAYGKTAHGLSKDFNVTLPEAEDIVNKWYGGRPEVFAWQQRTISAAMQEGCVRTLWGRRRSLGNINWNSKWEAGVAERICKNTPIQGSAADIVMGAMVKISRNERLRDMGWKMILQVHDEVIMEGPEESAEEAMALMVADMENPLDEEMLVKMIVDANMANTWYEAK